MQQFEIADDFIAAAVSGGGDSMAMALLLHDWATARGGKILALTVDHGLRPGSAAEAQKVAEEMKKRGIEHKILTWEGDKPQSAVQQAARAARYDLLTAECRRQGIKTLAVAHNLEDQAETFWMRLAHGSGLDGLAGMEARRELDGVTLIRPVLSFTRAELRATCAAYGAAWIEDPSNANEKFLRPRLRAFEEALGAEGFTPQRLAQTMRKLSRAAEALEFFATKSFRESVTVEEGRAVIDPAAFRENPPEIQSRLLVMALEAVSPQDYPPRSESLEALREAVLSPSFRGRTLAGCEIAPHKDGIVVKQET